MHARLKRFLLAGWMAATCFASPAVAQGSGPQVPERLGGFGRESAQTYREPGVGTSYMFRPQGKPIWATVYVYDLGQTDIPADVHASSIAAQQLGVIGAVQQQVQLGLATAVRVAEPAISYFAAPDCGRELALSRMEIDTAQARLQSYAALTTYAGKFVKVRLSHLRGQAELEDMASGFLKAVSGWLGDCMSAPAAAQMGSEHDSNETARSVAAPA